VAVLRQPRGYLRSWHATTSLVRCHSGFRFAASDEVWRWVGVLEPWQNKGWPCNEQFRMSRDTCGNGEWWLLDCSSWRFRLVVRMLLLLWSELRIKCYGGTVQYGTWDEQG
jgi:hypothetical protein